MINRLPVVQQFFRRKSHVVHILLLVVIVEYLIFLQFITKQIYQYTHLANNQNYHHTELADLNNKIQSIPYNNDTYSKDNGLMVLKYINQSLPKLEVLLYESENLQKMYVVRLFPKFYQVEQNANVFYKSAERYNMFYRDSLEADFVKSDVPITEKIAYANKVNLARTDYINAINKYTGSHFFKSNREIFLSEPKVVISAILLGLLGVFFIVECSLQAKFNYPKYKLFALLYGIILITMLVTITQFIYSFIVNIFIK